MRAISIVAALATTLIVSGCASSSSERIRACWTDAPLSADERSVLATQIEAHKAGRMMRFSREETRIAQYVTQCGLVLTEG
jgi:hypothetical protein